jgi:hypothetical protein
MLDSLPDEAVGRDSDAARRFGAGARQDRGRGAADSQKKAPDPAGDRRCERLIYDDPAGAFGVFERKDRAIRQQADRQSVPVDDPLEAQAVDPRRCEDCCWNPRHGVFHPSFSKFAISKGWRGEARPAFSNRVVTPVGVPSIAFVMGLMSAFAKLPTRPERQAWAQTAIQTDPPPAPHEFPSRRNFW